MFCGSSKSFQRDPGFVAVEGHRTVVKDIEGEEYLGFWTPSAMVLHHHPRVVEAIKNRWRN